MKVTVTLEVTVICWLEHVRKFAALWEFALGVAC
jgi:hypothetical protein